MYSNAAGGRRSIAALCALLAALGLGLLATSARADDGGLRYLGTQQLSPRLQELSFTTPALGGQTKVRVLLPGGYDPSGRTRYPVLYLLNGSLDDQTAWTTKGTAEQVSAGYPLIVVMPSGGPYGNYVDWYNGGAGGPPEWETYHIHQLLPWIDAHFPTVGTRAGRAVAGLSMGGGGTMHYAARHPDLFAAAGSFSGAVDTNNLFVQPLTDTAGIQDLWPPGSVYGHRQTDEVRWRGHNPWDLAENLKGLFLELDTGNGMPGGPGGDTGDPVEADVHEMSVSFHEKLQSLGIPHIWDDYGAGGHDWYYWDRDLSQFLPRLMTVFAHPAPLPVPFDYTAIDSDYGVYGWHVKIDRPALEFSELRGAGARGFELHGSGRADVATAAYYRPGQALDVQVRDLDGTTQELLHADGSGRLQLPLTLGPGNPYQEYSPQATAWLATRHAQDVPGRELDSTGGWPVYTAAVSVTPRPIAAHQARRAHPRRARQRGAAAHRTRRSRG